jgi:hypothetical protein
MRLWKKKQFWGVLIGVALLAYCVKDIRLSEIEVLLDRINFYYLIPSLIAAFLFIILRGLRWRILISQQKKIGMAQSVALYSAGQVLNIVMPVLTGQVGRLILFARKQGLRKTFVFSTIVLEIVFDAVSLIIFMFFTSLAFAFPSRYRYVSFVVAGITLVVLAVLYLILNFQQQLEELGRRRFRSRHPGVYITIRKFIRSFTQGIEMLRSSQHMFATIGYSLMSWTFHMLAIYFLFMSFGFGLPVASAAAIMIINTIVLMVPITPGNAGTFEFAVSTSLVAFSIGRSDAVLFALALHLVDLLPMFALGTTFMWYERVSIREIKDRHRDEVILDRISEEGTFIEEEQV